jgi:tRNA threonylcarbamoyladenosine biosynthesis protein TsaB
MILLLDTSTPVCRLLLKKDDKITAYEWKADRGLADGLLAYLRSQLKQEGATWSDLTGIGVFKGPGSFTGLRIGLTVLNTLADTLAIPIVGTTGEDWQDEAIRRLENGENEQLIMPLYGREANITKPRK